jgi:hypothetical protein
MRLPQIAAAMWLQTASRAVLNLISTRGLTRPFAPKFAPFPQVKYLHVHDGTKQPDAEVKPESEGSSAPDQLTPGAQNGDIDAKIALEFNLAKDKDVHTAAPRYSRGKHPNSAANQLRYNEEQRALGWPKLKARNEQQRALGWPKLKAGREKFQQEQRALGSQNAWQGVKKAVEAQRAAGFPHQKALAEKQRAAGWHSLKAYHEKARAKATRSPKCTMPNCLVIWQLPTSANSRKILHSNRCPSRFWVLGRRLQELTNGGLCYALIGDVVRSSQTKRN